MEKQIKQFFKDLFSKLLIEPEKISVSKDEKDSFQVDIQLKEEDSGILIGYHGDTIAALQLIAGLVLYKQSETWTRLIININDYRQKRTEALEKMAQDTVQRVKFSGEAIALFNLNPFERRVIHLYLLDHPDVVSQSEGEGRNRHLIISPRDPNASQPPPPNDD